MNQHKKRLLRAIFHEAHVIDLDFSQWDRRIRLVVVAWLAGKTSSSEPLYNIDFTDVASFSWRSHHLHVELQPRDRHCQWDIMESEIKGPQGSYLVKISGFGPTPELTIECGDVRVSRAKLKHVNSVNPGWGEPYKPLARPSLEELFRMK